MVESALLCSMMSRSLADIVSYKLLAACIITIILVDSILDNNRKTPIVCGKCHMVHDMANLLSCIGTD